MGTRNELPTADRTTSPPIADPPSPATMRLPILAGRERENEREADVALRNWSGNDSISARIACGSMEGQRLGWSKMDKMDLTFRNRKASVLQCGSLAHSMAH